MSSAPQLDFAVWLLDVGTFGIQTKGGRYIMIDGEWHLVTDRGRIRKESPIPGTWDAAMAIHDVVQEHLRHKIFVIPVWSCPPASGHRPAWRRTGPSAPGPWPRAPLVEVVRCVCQGVELG